MTQMLNFRLTVAAAVVAITFISARSEAARVCFEAEGAKTLTPPMQVIDSKEASEGLAVAILQGAGNPPAVGGEATYTFTIPEDGRYRLWCRVWWDDGCGNSLGMKIDDNTEFTFGQDGTYKTWHWVEAPPRLRQLDLKKGTHTLTVSNREDGVALDQILFVTSRRYVPVGIEKVTITAAAAPEITAAESASSARRKPELPWRVAGRAWSAAAGD